MDGLSPKRVPPPRHATNDIAVVAPPEASAPAPSSLVARLVPIVTAVVTAGVMAAAYYARSTVARNPAFMMLPLMMLVSAIATTVSGVDRRRGEVNARRADYLEYLSEIRNSAVKTAAAQHCSMVWCHPDPDTLWTLIGGPRMWERTPTDSDFCSVRIGVGNVSLATRLIEPPMDTVHRFDPVGVSALKRLLHTHSTVANIPIVVALSGSATVTLRGDGSQARALARAMICQLAVMHSPATVLIAAVVTDVHRPHWEWLKWLPHNRHPTACDDAGPVRMVYSSLSSARDAVVAHGYHGVVVVDSEEGVGDAARSGVATLAIDGIDDDPVTVVVCGHLVGAQADRLSNAAALLCAQRLAGCRGGPSPATSRGTDWQHLVDIVDVASYSPVAHRIARRGMFLRVPLGIDAAGAPVELEIKEAAAKGMGPHGLCIGATGSGKSELLRTVALGMIVGHSSEELNLVLVDFKGGATFAGLEPAPHVAAVITNLADKAALVTRMRDALMGEMNRRQEVLRAAGNFDGIAAYQRRRRAGARLDSLPVLFIIVDEFSELLTQQPDFADVFVAIGRLGRSLGIHLLLASQRLDEGRLRGLESHLSYRLCLKTLSSNDSRLVLGTSAAYELPATPGAAYLRVGTDAPIRFQTAFVSGPTPAAVHEPGRSTRGAAPGLVHPFTTAPVGQVSVDQGAGTEPAEYPSVLQAIVGRLSTEGPRAHEVWLPPLSASPELDAVLHDVGPTTVLTAPIAVVDRPFEQRRTPLVVDVSGAAGNVALVGAPQSGKSTALRTLITALAVTHEPRLVQFYCLDFGGGSLAALRDWPHVGSVAGRSDIERVRSTLSRLGGIVRARETLFRQHGIESMAHYRQLRAAHDPRCDRFGDVFLVVDGWVSLQREFEAAESWVTSLAADGLSYGVHVIIAASRWPEIRPALRDQIGTRIELRLGDPSDSEIDRRLAHEVPVSTPGRGLSPDGLHMVIALARLDGDDSPLRLSRGWTAPPVPVLPARIDLDLVIGQAGALNAGPIVGVEETELEPLTIDFTRQLHLLILGDSECGKTATLRTLCRELMRTSTPAQSQLFVVDPRRSLLGVVGPESGHLGGYLPSADAIADAMPQVLGALRRRMSSWSGPDIYIVIDDYELVDGVGGNPLMPLLEMLPYSRDVGMHVVVARRSGGAARALFEPVLAGIRDAGCATLLMSASPDDGLAIGTVRPSPQPPGRGMLISRGRGDPQMIHVGWTP
ncbi:type VII secretion protein EccCb [Mycobacterium paraterrae]|uniref:Type VII secretion protein EccCb n=1 Tax=Mycobacterium paraterrae TaxID=577492 RepID=A0ABY3VGP3_9MYCO|nr:type VII secretion protein EccCb [Mycobacterium paraterrae]UMB68589.1 type VII secretion protein EccCb [Mycobacterium paraterrae]